MINTLSLLFSLLAVGVIVVRAAMLDRTLPWFKPVPKQLPKLKRQRYGTPTR